MLMKFNFSNGYESSEAFHQELKNTEPRFKKNLRTPEDMIYI